MAMDAIRIWTLILPTRRTLFPLVVERLLQQLWQLLIVTGIVTSCWYSCYSIYCEAGQSNNLSSPKGRHKWELNLHLYRRTYLFIRKATGNSADCHISWCNSNARVMTLNCNTFLHTYKEIAGIFLNISAMPIFNWPCSMLQTWAKNIPCWGWCNLIKIVKSILWCGESREHYSNADDLKSINKYTSKDRNKPITKDCEVIKVFKSSD